MTKENFVQILSQLWQEHQEDLFLILHEAERKRLSLSWFWDVYLMSMCTMGGSANYSRKREHYGNSLNWENVVNLVQQDRLILFNALPNPRWRIKVQQALENTFQRIKAAGGPINIQLQYDAYQTDKEIIKFLCTFEQIGNKYARNIPMDIGDQRITNFIALDDRINRVIDNVDGAPPKEKYRQRETFVVALGVDAEIPNAWFTDRLIYNYYFRFLNA